MRISKFLCVLSAVLFISFSANAQSPKTRKADEAYNNWQWSEAIELYKKALTKIDNKTLKAEVLFKLGECYKHINDLKNAESSYAKAVKAKYPDPRAQLYVADCQKAQEKYTDAMTSYNEYKKLVPSDPRGDDGVKSCTIAQKWKDSPTRHEVTLCPFNSKVLDFAPSYADKKYNTIWFSSMREGATGSGTDGTTGQSFSDIYEVKRDKKGAWNTPALVDKMINTGEGEGAMAFNKKKDAVYYTRCPKETKKTLGCMIMVSTKKGQGWGQGEEIVLCPDSFTVGHPSVNADESVLYFASDMPGGLGGKDLWKVKLDKQRKPVGDPTNLGPMINTAGDEMFPYITENALYFASNGLIGMGGLDNFKAAVSGDGFSVPENLKFPINSAADDFGICIEAKNENGFFTSCRAGGKGMDDIYEFRLPPVLFSLAGVVKNLDNGDPIIGSTVKLIGSDGSSVEAKSDATGNYRFDFTPDGKRYVNANVSYTVSASMENHLADTKDFTTVGIETQTDFTKDLLLKPIKKEVGFRLPEILYDLSAWDLKPQYQDSLAGLVKTMEQNPNIVIELGSHTDTRGDNKSNEILAQKRAQSVVDYLVSKGIAGDRMVAKGYGESRPIVTDKEIAAMATEEEKEIGHQKNRRSEFKVIREDYVPKEDPNTKKAPKVQNAEEEEE
ncbi:MAG TPA: OmpA family protein [Bacteroidia bacterium]|nr:OmpA family protein [Bacteroidia bacterium]